MHTDQAPTVVLGGSGFIGRHVVAEAVRTGRSVKALVRSEASAELLRAAGASTFRGLAEQPDRWIHEVEGARAIVDLVQPSFPKRVGSRRLAEISAQRQHFTKALVAALRSLPVERRPFLISVSGIDDLAPDASGCISERSSLREHDYGLNPIGIPVRKLIEHAEVDAAFVYLPTVYGPGKAFAETIFPSIAAGKWKNFGRRDDRIALVHVQDAARAIVAVMGSEPANLRGKSFVFGDDAPTGLNAFFDLAASLMGAAMPGRVPPWLASIAVGRPLVEVMISNDPIRSSIVGTSDRRLYPSYREGLPATLKSLGLSA